MSHFTFDGIKYQDADQEVLDANGNPIMTVILDVAEEYWIAEANNGVATRVHANEPNARMSAILALLASDEC